MWRFTVVSDHQQAFYDSPTSILPGGIRSRDIIFSSQHSWPFAHSYHVQETCCQDTVNVVVNLIALHTGINTRFFIRIH